MDPVLLITAYVVLGVVLIWTSIIDIKTREVPDWLSASLLLFGVAFAALVDTATATMNSLVIGSLVAAGFIALWLLDGFVFFPKAAAFMERLPWYVQGLVSLGICVLALGASAILTDSVPALARALGGASVGYTIGVTLYWSRQWGGGDAKLLAGVGAILGFDIAYLYQILGGNALPAPSFAWFLVLLLISGAVYGAAWLGILAIIRRKVFLPAFRTTLASMRVLRFIVWGLTALVLALGVYSTVQLDALYGVFCVVLAAIIYGGFYLVVAVRAAEHALMTVPRTPKQLVAGDWVLGPIIIGKKTIIPKASAGVSEREIAALRKAAPAKKVFIRQGVPFVPSFLLAFLILTALRWWVLA